MNGKPNTQKIRFAAPRKRYSGPSLIHHTCELHLFYTHRIYKYVPQLNEFLLNKHLRD